MGNEADAAAVEGTGPQDTEVDAQPQNTGEGEGAEPQDPKPAEGKNTPNVHKLERDVANRDKRIAELEAQLGLTPTGTISGQSDYNRTKVQVRIERGLYDCGYTRHGSTCVRALQCKLGVEVDGQMGPGTVKALQAWLNDKVGAGLAVDGYYGPATSRAVGRALEAGLFRG